MRLRARRHDADHIAAIFARSTAGAWLTLVGVQRTKDLATAWFG
jgi:hypothetical protein